MAYIICTECNRWFSEKVCVCPFCGYQLTPEEISEMKESTAKTQKDVSDEHNRVIEEKKGSIKTFCLIFSLSLIVLIFLAVIYLCGNPPPPLTSEKPERFKEGEIVNVGQISYNVIKSAWATRLYVGDYSKKPDATFLLVKLSVYNRAAEAKTIPTFFLLDQYGKEYVTSNIGWPMDSVISEFDILNPDVKKTGTIIFDIPKDNTYFLRVSSGYRIDETELIELAPKEKR
jgi:hypothetical protein